MKLKFFFASVAVAAMAFTSCTKGGSSSVSAPEAKTFEDSVAMFHGLFAGSQALDILAEIPDSLKAKHDKDAMIAGMKYILEADTAGSFQDGLQMGLQILSFVNNAAQAGIKLDPKVVMGYFAQSFLADSVNHAQLEELSPKAQAVMTRFQDKMMTAQYEQQAKMQAQMQMMFDKNAAAGNAFIAEQKAKDPTLKTTESGLVYKVDKQGAGAVAKADSEVKVIYTGKHIDGTVFDSSENQVAAFKTNEVVPGFAEALTLFPAGSKVTLFVPSALGYGMNGAPGIQPGETLVFELEIVEE